MGILNDESILSGRRLREGFPAGAPAPVRINMSAGHSTGVELTIIEAPPYWALSETSPVVAAYFGTPIYDGEQVLFTDDGLTAPSTFPGVYIGGVKDIVTGAKAFGQAYGSKKPRWYSAARFTETSSLEGAFNYDFMLKGGGFSVVMEGVVGQTARFLFWGIDEASDKGVVAAAEDGAVVVYLLGPQNQRSFIFPDVVTGTDPHQVTIVYDPIKKGGFVALYVDGSRHGPTQTAEGLSDPAFTSADPFILNNNAYEDGPAMSDLLFFGLYDRPLSQSEIQNLNGMK